MRFCFVLYFFFANTRFLSKLLIIFNLNSVLLHTIHNIYLQDKKLSREPNITANSKIYFICRGFKNFYNNCLSHFEVDFWTSMQ